jgi:hypothetical protein
LFSIATTSAFGSDDASISILRAAVDGTWDRIKRRAGQSLESKIDNARIDVIEDNPNPLRLLLAQI